MDEDADARIAAFFQARGHIVVLSRERLERGSADFLVAAAAEQLGAVVVTRNTKHFRRLIYRDDPTKPPSSFQRAGLLCFRCDDAVALHRLVALIDVIEREYEFCLTLADPRLIIEITDRTMQVVR